MVAVASVMDGDEVRQTFVLSDAYLHLSGQFLTIVQWELSVCRFHVQGVPPQNNFF